MHRARIEALICFWVKQNHESKYYFEFQILRKRLLNFKSPSRLQILFQMFSFFKLRDLRNRSSVYGFGCPTLQSHVYTSTLDYKILFSDCWKGSFEGPWQREALEWLPSKSLIIPSVTAAMDCFVTRDRENHNLRVLLSRLQYEVEMMLS